MRHVVRLLMLIIVTLIIAACGGSDSNDVDGPQLPTLIPTETNTVIPSATPIPILTSTPAPTRIPPPRTSGLDPDEAVSLRLYNMISDFDPMNVTIQGLRFITNLSYGRSAPPSTIAIGEYPLSVTSNINAEVLLEQNLVLTEGGEELTLFLAGPAAAPVLIRSIEDVSPLGTDESRINVIHTIPGTQQFEIRREGEPIATALSFGQESGPQVLPAGEATFELVFNGEIIHTFELDMEERTITTVIIYSDADRQFQPSTVNFETRVPGRAQATLLQMSPDIGSVDLYFNGDLAATALDYTRRSEPQIIPNGTNRLSIYPTGANPDESDPLAVTDFNVNAGDVLTVIVLGTLEDLSVAQYEFDPSPVPVDTARITFVHALAGGTAVEVAIGNTIIRELNRLTFRSVSNDVLLRTGEYDFNWYIAGSDATLETGLGLQLEEGWNYLYLMTGRSQDQPPVIFGEFVGIDDGITFTADGTVPTPPPATRARFVNAMSDGTILDLYIGDDLVAPGITPLNASQPNEVNAEVQRVAVSINGTDDVIQEMELEFVENFEYTIYAYGNSSDDIRLVTAIDGDFAFSEDQTTIRLLNTSQEDTEYTLGYRPHTGPTFRPTPDPTSIAEGVGNRIPVRSDVSQIIRDVEANRASLESLILVGENDIYLINSDEGFGIVLEEAFTIEAGMHYDVIAVQPANVEIPQLIIISYPAF